MTDGTVKCGAGEWELHVCPWQTLACPARTVMAHTVLGEAMLKIFGVAVRGWGKSWQLGTGSLPRSCSTWIDAVWNETLSSKRRVAFLIPTVIKRLCAGGQFCPIAKLQSVRALGWLKLRIGVPTLCGSQSLHQLIFHWVFN